MKIKHLQSNLNNISWNQITLNYGIKKKKKKKRKRKKKKKRPHKQFHGFFVTNNEVKISPFPHCAFTPFIKNMWNPRNQFVYWKSIEFNNNLLSVVIAVSRKIQSLLHSAQCGNCRHSLSHFFRKIFVKAMVVLKKLLKCWFNEIFFSEREFYVFPHCAVCVEITEIYCHTFLTKISWKQLKKILKSWFDEIFLRPE